MSTTLVQRSLCSDAPDYETLLASLALAKSILDCDSDGNVIDGPGSQILTELFGVEAGVWPKACFFDLEIYYYLKNCSMSSVTWQPTIVAGDCIDNALPKLGLTGLNQTFKVFMDAVVDYFNNGLMKTLEDVIVVLNAVCQVLAQKSEAKRHLRKIGMVVGDCDL